MSYCKSFTELQRWVRIYSICVNLSHKRVSQRWIKVAICMNQSRLEFSSAVCIPQSGPLTFTSWTRGCRTKPHVLLGIHISLNKTLRFFIWDKCKVPTALLAPSLGAEKSTLDTSKLIAGAFKGLLVPLTGNSNFHPLFSTKQTAECH